MMNQPAPRYLRHGSARLIAVVAVIIFVSGAVMAWKMGRLGGTTPVAPTKAEASNESSVERANSGQGSTPTDLKQQKVDEALDSAGRYVNSNHLGEAEKILEALRERNPENPAVLRQLYELRLFQGRYEDAYDTIRALIRVDAADPEQCFNAGTIAFKIKKFTQAEAHYRQAAALDAANPKYPLYLAQVQIKLHAYNEAKIQLLKVLQLDPSVHEAFGSLAEIALIQNKLEMAAQNIARARQVAPDFFRWRVIEAKIIRRQNDPEEALRRLNAISDPNLQLLTEVVEEKAKCWGMLGKPEQAAQVYVEQLNSYPDAWLSAVRASEYFSIAGNDTQAQLWFFYARERAPEGAREIVDLAKRFADPSSDEG